MSLKDVMKLIRSNEGRSDTVLGMLTPRETEFLRGFSSKDYAGRGAIVDLGCWFGMSTMALAAGLRDHTNRRLRAHRVHAFDLFRWEAWMDEHPSVRASSLNGRLEPGDSFFDECRRQTAKYEANIEFHPGDLSTIGWSGGPIEFLFIDAMKSWPLANGIIHDFYGSLIPGTSVVVHQDFAHFYGYWIHLTTYRLREYFQPVYDIPACSSLVFKYVAPIPLSLLQAAYDSTSTSNDEIEAAFEYARNLVGSEKQPHIAAAKVRCYLEREDRDGVERAMHDLSASMYLAAAAASRTMRWR